MFAVMVKPSARKRICTNGRVWVKNDRHEFYVRIKERGLWQTKAEAKRMITEPWEIVVEVRNAKLSSADSARNETADGKAGIF